MPPLSPSTPTADAATLLVGGAWLSSAAAFPVVDPATGATIGTVSDADVDDAVRALDAACSAYDGWSRTPAEHRSTVLRAGAAAIREDAEELAVLMTRENGKPLGEARGEVLNCARILEWSAEEGRRANGRVLPAAAHGPAMTTHSPVGPVLAISPWNFPGSMFVRKIALALAAGCTVVAKPAESTPLIAIALTDRIIAGGVPAGVLNLLTTSRPGPVTEALLADARLRKVSFTGSTAVGLSLAAPRGGRLRRTSLELGGHSPAIVLPDADLDRTAAAVVAAKFANAGQSCTAINRVYVHAALADQLLEAIRERVAELRIGHGLEEGISMGPLIDERALAKVERHIEDAVQRGARVVTGGGRPAGLDPALTGAFYEPTVLTDVPTDALVACEETFGPVLPVFVYADVDEAVERANGLPYGLASYVFGKDLEQLWSTIDRLDFGVIGVNDPFPVRPELPFGGTKNSGFEREGGAEGIDSYLETKAVSFRFA